MYRLLRNKQLVLVSLGFLSLFLVITFYVIAKDSPPSQDQPKEANHEKTVEEVTLTKEQFSDTSTNTKESDSLASMQSLVPTHQAPPQVAGESNNNDPVVEYVNTNTETQMVVVITATPLPTFQLFGTTSPTPLPPTPTLEPTPTNVPLNVSVTSFDNRVNGEGEWGYIITAQVNITECLHDYIIQYVPSFVSPNGRRTNDTADGSKTCIINLNDGEYGGYFQWEGKERQEYFAYYNDLYLHKLVFEDGREYDLSYYN